MALQVARIVASDDTVIGLSRELLSCPNQDKTSFEFDMTHVPFLRIGQIGLLAMYGKWAKQQFGSGQMIGLNLESDVVRYLQRIDFFKYFNLNVPERFTRHKSNQLVEIKEILDGDQNNVNEIASKFREVIVAKSRLDTSVISAVDKSFGEIMDNVQTHSRTSIPGIAASQYYPSERYIEICVADAGIGIPASLRMNSAYQDLANQDLLMQAFDMGIGENVYGANQCDEGYGCGYGLAFASKLTQASKGELWAISHSDAIHIGEDGIEGVDGCWFPGTLVCMRIPSNIILSEEDLDLDGRARPNRPFYWDEKGNELEDICENDILW